MGDNPYAGQSLDNQTQGAFAQSLGTFGDMASGNRSLANTDLTPYMNPFTQNVVNTSMSELDRQQQQQNLQVADTAQSQNAFGGDRFAIQQAENDRNWNAQKAHTASNLYNTGFNTAMSNAQQDITNQAGAAVQLGDLANQGFNWGNDLAAASNAAAGAQGNVLQQLTDAIKGQYQGFTNQGTIPGLTALSGIFNSLGGNMSSSTSSGSGSGSSMNFGMPSK